jgi:hypothetical protein
VQQVLGRRGRVGLLAGAVPEEVHYQHRLLLVRLSDRFGQRRVHRGLGRVEQQPRIRLAGHLHRGALAGPGHQQIAEPDQQPLRPRQPADRHRSGVGGKKRQLVQRRALGPDHQSQPPARHDPGL